MTVHSVLTFKYIYHGTSMIGDLPEIDLTKMSAITTVVSALPVVEAVAQLPVVDMLRGDH